MSAGRQSSSGKNGVRLELFDYPLPPDRIAQHPLEPRDAARLLVLDPVTRALEHRRIRDLPEYLRPGDLLVFNDTRVLPARLAGRKATGGAVEALLLRHLAPGRWEALVKPGRRIPPGTELEFGSGELRARAGDRCEEGTRELRFIQPEDPEAADALAARLGVVPLPPYITEPLADSERYQTVYARAAGSAAAPTAGLHFTPRLLRALEERGVRIAFVTLHVGIATFRPVRTPEIKAHQMHMERYSISQESAAAIRACPGRIVAVGTTTARCLESAATGERQVRAGEAETDLYIRPGYRFRILDALLTNFHMPKSSLLILIAAFAGRDAVMESYEAALRTGYRFLSFGDAMLITRRVAPVGD
jgi:S-adenosylmethionine:tRNA ribosyltransferase-isomerase